MSNFPFSVNGISSNLIKYTKENGNIKINVKEETDKVHVMVCDNGIGIPKKEHDKIFNRFCIIESQLHHKDKEGLSLAIVKEIIEAHDGNIWVESVEGKGSIFHFTLPKDEIGERNEKSISCT